MQFRHPIHQRNDTVDSFRSLWQHNLLYAISLSSEVDLLRKTLPGFSIYEIKATETISSGLFRQMDRFETLASPAAVAKTLIYGGTENQKRTNYQVLSWRDISDQEQGT